MELGPSKQTIGYKAIVANIKNDRRELAEFIANLIRTNSHMSPESLSSFESWYEKDLE